MRKNKKIIITEEELNKMYIEKIERRMKERSIDPATGKKRKVVFYRAGSSGGYYDYE